MFSGQSTIRIKPDDFERYPDYIKINGKKHSGRGIVYLELTTTEEGAVLEIGCFPEIMTKNERNILGLL